MTARGRTTPKQPKLRAKGGGRRRAAGAKTTRDEPRADVGTEGVRTLRELDAWIEREGIRFFKIGVFDVDGVLRGKYVDREKLRSAVDKGFGFCDVVLGWDAHDALYEGAGVTVSGWHTGYRDAAVRLDLASLRRIPFEEDTLLLIGSFQGDYADVCPRTLLSRTLDRAEAMGFGVRAAFEYEFFLFDETPASVRAKGYRNLEPVTPGMFGYSVLRNSVHAELYHDLLDAMKGLDCALEGLHTETGPGVIEAAIRHARGLAAADKAALFKTFTKVFAQRADLMATFMAKWSDDYPGQSGHLHLSLCDARSGRNVFHVEGGRFGMSETMERFVAGQVRYLPELLAMVCSTINAYRRLVPGMWAPTSATWGVENRTTAIRVIPGGAGGQRSEYRIAPADGNPYLVLAAALASGLRGIEEGLALPDPIEGNAYDDPNARRRPLPVTLREASASLRGSKMARSVFGDAFVDHYAATRDWEDEQFRKQVSDWDLARYFEII
ncbi:MAG: glutamine synthetase [Spirochaetaceae bacterium]|nr:glutamine synthetase [Spirochaetaceae bacterium]